MKKYKVTIVLMLDPSRDIDTNKPKTKEVEFLVEADNKSEAVKKARELETSLLSIWEIYSEEIPLT